MKKQISIFALLLGACAAVGSAIGADTQTVNGGYYFVENEVLDPEAGNLDTSRMSIGGDGSTGVRQGLKSGDKVTFVATPGAGLKVAQWGITTKSTLWYSNYSWTDATSDSYTWTANPEVSDKACLAVNFKYITYTVKYDADGGTGAPSEAKGNSYNANFTVSNTKPTKVGYTFDKWKADTNGKTYSAGAIVAGSELCKSDWHEDGKVVTLTAQWTANKYQIKFDKNGGSGSMANMSCTYGQSAELTANAFTQAGYAFAGWNTKADGTGIHYDDGAAVWNLTSEKDAVVTLYAEWTINTYSVEIVLNGGSFPEGDKPQKLTKSTDEVFSMAAPERENWTFAGWTVAKVPAGSSYDGAMWGISPTDVKNAIADANTKCQNGARGAVYFKNLSLTPGVQVFLTANWQGQARTISARQDPEDAGTVSGATTYTDGDTATLTAVPNAGWSFKRWEREGVPVSDQSTYSFVVAGDAEYTATFTGNVYKVSFVDGYGGTAPEAISVTYGQPYGDLPEVTYDNPILTFSRWLDSKGQVVTGETIVSTAGNQTLHADKPSEQKTFDVIWADPSGKNAWETNRNQSGTISLAHPKTKNWPDRRGNSHWIKGWNPPLPVTLTSNTTITAVWESYSDVLDCPDLQFEVPPGNWFVNTNKTFCKAGDSCLQITDGVSGSIVKTKVTEPGTLTFHWKAGSGTTLYVGYGNAQTNFVAGSTEGWTNEVIQIYTATPSEPTEIQFDVSSIDFNDYCALDTVTWTPSAPVVTYKVTYDKGNYGEGTGRVDEKTNGVDLVLSDRLFTRDNYTQDGWSKNADGTTKDYVLGGTYAENAAIKLYPHWLENGKYTVSYLAGTDATGSVGAQAAHVGETVVLLGDGHFSRTGYSQDGWATVDLGEKAFDFGKTYDKNVSTNLYPCWTNNRYTVTFNPNGGSVTPAAKVVIYDVAYGDLPPSAGEREGYKFTGWTLTSGGAVTAATIVKTAADHDLVAQWSKDRGPYSEALDCTNLRFEPSVTGWFVSNDSPHKGVSCLRSQTPGAELTTTITESGTLCFWWKGDVTRRHELHVVTNNVTAMTMKLVDESVDWTEVKDFKIVASAANPVELKFACSVKYFSGEITEYFAIDHVTWKPDVEPFTGTYTLHFKVADGLVKPSDMNCVTGMVYNLPALPSEYKWRRTDAGGRLYDGGVLVFDLIEAPELELEAVKLP